MFTASLPKQTGNSTSKELQVIAFRKGHFVDLCKLQKYSALCFVRDILVTLSVEQT